MSDGSSSYEVVFTESAAKEFRSLPRDVRQRMAPLIDSLRHDARPRGVRKLKGHESTYRARVGHYRIVYEMDDRNRTVRITHVRHRRDAYR